MPWVGPAAPRRERDAAGLTGGSPANLVYIDGKPAKFDTPNNNLSGSLETDKPFHLGRREKSLPFTGWIDELRIFDGVLSATDVERLSQLESPEIGRAHV